jgi:threonine dehydrogenase-like Zn-dependent dehydrogenase
MKAAVVKGKRRLAYEEVPMPSVEPGELLLKMRYCSICGSDLEYIDSVKPGDPVQEGGILGHEFAAEVAEVGKGVEGWSVGDRVTIADSRAPCGECFYCHRQLHHLCQGRDMSPRTLPLGPGGHLGPGKYAFRPGSMAEYFVRPAITLQKVPGNVSDEEAALVEPLRTGVSGVITTGLKLGDSAVIFGAGKIGLGAMLCAKAAGASPVVVLDLVQSRLDKALEIGADAVFNPAEVDAVPEVVKVTEAGPDVVLICTRGGKVLGQAADMVRRGGTIGLAGWLPDAGIEPMVWWGKQIKFTGVAGGFGGPSGLIYTAMRLIANRQVDVKPLITEIVPLSEAQRAIDSMFSGENIAALLKP